MLKYEVLPGKQLFAGDRLYGSDNHIDLDRPEVFLDG
jgi:hypothetical protein